MAETSAVAGYVAPAAGWAVQQHEQEVILQPYHLLAEKKGRHLYRQLA